MDRWLCIRNISLTQLTTHQNWAFCEASQIEVTKQLYNLRCILRNTTFCTGKVTVCRNLRYIQVRVVVKLGWVVEIIPVFRFQYSEIILTQTHFYRDNIFQETWSHSYSIRLVSCDLWFWRFSQKSHGNIKLGQKFNNPIQNLVITGFWISTIIHDFQKLKCELI